MLPQSCGGNMREFESTPRPLIAGHQQIPTPLTLKTDHPSSPHADRSSQHVHIAGKLNLPISIHLRAPILLADFLAPAC
jgi:hypothetical protein